MNVNIIAEAIHQLKASLRKEYPNTETTSEDLKNLFFLKLAAQPREVFSVAFFNQFGSMLCQKDLFNGTIDEVHVYMRELVKEAIMSDAMSVVICHNHPNGRAFPSTDDLQLTNQCEKALALVGIRLLDHIIVGHEEAISLREEGLWKPN